MLELLRVVRPATAVSSAGDGVAPKSPGSSWVCEPNCQSVTAPALEGAIYCLHGRVPTEQETSLSPGCGHGRVSVILPHMFSLQGHAADVFEAYTQLLTEMVLRLPYQIKRSPHTNSRIPPPVFDHLSWFYFFLSGGE